MAGSVALDARDITKCYDLGKECELVVLKGVSVKIKKGEFVSIMGPSGSGKSTLMHILGCLDKPTTGDLFVSGTNAAQMNDDELAEVRRKYIGFVFQSFFLIPHLTALGNVELPMKIASHESDTEEKAMKILNGVGLGQRTTHMPQELSGGEKQRVAIARALANDPEILMADEPTGNLDSKSGKEIMGLLTTFWKRGKTIVMVTHDSEIAKYSQKIIKIRDGIIEKEVVL